MPGTQRPHLRIVGGNEALVRMARVNREARWPPLRVVGAADFAAQPVPITPSAVPASKRVARSQALMAGLVAVMLTSVGQAIADYL
jgi:hypothetical protein